MRKSFLYNFAPVPFEIILKTLFDVVVIFLDRNKV
jgi:hypothetical protein